MSFTSLRRVIRSARKGLCATCSKTRYPQLEAAGAGHVGCLIYTLETIGSLIKDDHEVTAMHVAARKGQISVLIYLIENSIVKPDSVFRAKNGASPAHDAAGTGNIECLRYLLSRTQAGPNDIDYNGATLLHWAAQSGHLKVVQWLVSDAQAPIDVMAKNGITPFHLAAAKNHLDVLRWLVGYAFRHHPHPMKLVNAKDKNGSTPLYHAAHAGHFGVVQWLATKGGGDPTVSNKQGLAPLHAATIAGNIKIVQFLFQFGLATAPGGLRTSEGASSMHFAAAENHIEILNWLLSNKECSGNERDYYHSTPLHDASENGHIIAVKMLCDAKADPSLLDIEGNTPRDLAIKHSHPKCATYLDNYTKDIMRKRINGSITTDPSAASGKSKLQRNRQSQGQIMDKYRHAPPHMKPVNAFEADDDYILQMMGNTGSEGWETLHDLMDEEEIEQLSQLDQDYDEQDVMLTEAEEKRRIFEEKMIREHEERQRKMEAAVKQEEEREMEIRSQFMREDSFTNGNKLKPLEETLKEGHQKLESQLGRVKTDSLSMQAKMKKKEKSQSLPRSLTEPQNMKNAATRTKDDMDTSSVQSKRSMFSKLLGKRSSNTPSSSGISSSKSWSSDSSSIPLRKPRRPDPHEWSIPNPPPLPTVEFLTGKSRVAYRLNYSLKEELQKAVPAMWNRDAYDDEEDEESGSDSEKQIDKQALQNKNKALKGKGKKKKGAEVNPVKPKKASRPPPLPSISSVQVPKSDLLITQNRAAKVQQPVRPAPPPPPTPPEEDRNTKVKPLTLPSPPPPAIATPIAKAASARSRKSPMQRQDTPAPSVGFASQLSEALQSAQGQDPKVLHYQPPISPAGHEMRSFTALHTSINRSNQQSLGPRPKMQRQASLNEESKEESDDSFTSSSDEETESSEDDDSSGSDDEEEYRPIMARNMGIHGARIAKEVMQRMKNQRYPSIFRKPIVTLDTVIEVRHEIVYEADTREEMADVFVKFMRKKKVMSAWRKHIKSLNYARHKAEAMARRRKRDLMANVFYSWIQVKNEADVEVEERIKNARESYKKHLKKKVFHKWRAITATGLKYGELDEKSLQWLNAQLLSTGRQQVDDLFKSLADGTLIIIALANASGKKAPKYKPMPKLKLHKQDNWKVAHTFMDKIGINTRDFEASDLADLQDHTIHNMFINIFKWLE